MVGPADRLSELVTSKLVEGMGWGVPVRYTQPRLPLIVAQGKIDMTSKIRPRRQVACEEEMEDSQRLELL